MKTIRFAALLAALASPAPGQSSFAVWNTHIDTLAELNSIVADATLDDSSSPRPPTGAAGGDLGGTYPDPSVVDDSHAHTGATLSAVDISSDTNLAVTAPVTLTGDTVGLQALGGDVTGTIPAMVVVDDSHAHTGATVTAPGSNTQVIFNDGGSLGADPYFYFTKSTTGLILNGIGSGSLGNLLTLDANAPSNAFLLRGPGPTNAFRFRIDGASRPVYAQFDSGGTQTIQLASSLDSYFDGSADVCIGSTSCSTKFTVTGNASVSGTMTAGTVSGANVTSGSNPGHTHTASALTGTPGGELGGTWSSPTVDSVHSGSAHHSGDHTNLVTGPASATSTAFARFDGTGGKTIQNSAVTADGSGNVTATSTSVPGAGRKYSSAPGSAVGAATELCILDAGSYPKTIGICAATSSSRHIKRSIRPLRDSLARVLDLRPVSYLYRKGYEQSEEWLTRRQIGLLAEEVAEVVPEVVFGGSSPGVDYERLVTVLIGAVQDQQRQIAELYELVATLYERLEE